MHLVREALQARQASFAGGVANFLRNPPGLVSGTDPASGPNWDMASDGFRVPEPATNARGKAMPYLASVRSGGWGITTSRDRYGALFSNQPK